MMERLNKMPSFSIVKPQGAFYVFVDISQVIGKQFEGKS